MEDSRRYFLAGYLSAEPEFTNRPPDGLLPLADRILTVLDELTVDADGTIVVMPRG